MGSVCISPILAPLTAAAPTNSLSRRRGFPLGAPCRENRCGTSETCEYSRARGRTTMHNRSSNSYMRSPRKVTAQPMGMPLRILKFAMDFFARVIIALCPVIWPSSTAAVSNSLAFWLASPRPMFTVIFCNLGTAMQFFQPKRFINAATVSPRYFSCNRLFIAFLCLVLYELLVQRRLAMPASAHLRAVRQNRVADACVLAAARANDHHVGNVDGCFLLHDPPLDVLRMFGTCVAL